MSFRYRVPICLSDTRLKCLPALLMVFRDLSPFSTLEDGGLDIVYKFRTWVCLGSELSSMLAWSQSMNVGRWVREMMGVNWFPIDREQAA